MNIKFTYLLVNVFTLLGPLAFSFPPKSDFYRSWPSLFLAMLLSGVLFITWDAYFTHLGIWGFNTNYITGLYIGNLPVEEVLFFICIPYACVFTWFNIAQIIKPLLTKNVEDIITLALIITCILMAGIYNDHAYTLLCFAVLAVLLFAARYVFKVTWLFKFYVTYLILLAPFLIVNGLLTGTGLTEPVVWYTNAQTLGIRLLTIPVEDIFYGMGMVLMNVLIFEKWKLKDKVAVKS